METSVMKLETPELESIEKSRASQIRAVFIPMTEMLGQFEKEYNHLVAEAEKGVTKEISQKAKRVRLNIGKVRIETGKLKDKQKEYIKLEDKAIMGVHNIIVWAVKEKEDKLKEIEDYFENKEKERLDSLQRTRVEQLSKYVDDAHLRTLSNMEQDVWEAYLSTKKKEHEDRVEAEKKAEEDRVAAEKAAALEQERIRKENERLKKEAEEREKAAKVEAERRAKEEAERVAREEKERKAREEKERKEKEAHEAELLAERKKREQIEKEEREKRLKLEAELKAKEEAERVAREAEEARVQAELGKKDADKLKDLEADLVALKEKYSFSSAKNKRMYYTVCLMLDDIVKVVTK